MGGWRNKWGETKNDVWYSEDGINWNIALASASWSPREGHSVFVFKDKIWVIGGVDFLKRKSFNDVWYSEDGVHWVEAVSEASWSPRYDQTVTVFQDKLWLIGGLFSAIRLNTIFGFLKMARIGSRFLTILLGLEGTGIFQKCLKTEYGLSGAGAREMAG